MVNERGSASVEMIILTTLLMVFIILPLVALGIERLIIYYSINMIIEAMEAALFSVTATTDMRSLSETHIHYDVSLIETEFRALIEEKLGDLVEIEIVDLIYYPVEAIQMPCQPKVTLTHDTLHTNLDVWYEHKLYRHLISDETKRRVQFHFDLELPQNR
jgi:hypothetical protein